MDFFRKEKGVSCKAYKVYLLISLSPFSTLSLPCTMFLPTSTPKSPLMVPQSASVGFVAPIIFLPAFTTSVPSHNCRIKKIGRRRKTPKSERERGRRKVNPCALIYPASEKRQREAEGEGRLMYFLSTYHADNWT